MDRFKLLKQHGFLLKLATATILVFTWDWMFWQHRSGLGTFGIYSLALLAGLVLIRPKTIASPNGISAVIAGVIYCAAIFVQGSPLSFLLFWTAISVAALSPFTSHLKDGWQWFWRLVVHAFVSPFSPIIDVTRLMKVRKRVRGSKINMQSVFGLLALPVLGGLVFLALFIQANPVLESVFAQITLPAFDAELAARALIWSIVGTAVWTLFRPWHRRGPRPEKTETVAWSIQSPPLASILLSLVIFNSLFLMQNGMDLAFMGGFVPLPDELTLAQYAHRGAYPLIVTALLAGLFVLVLMSPGSEANANKHARRLVSAWITQNVLLVVSSIVRTWDYVEAYSLTEMRIAALAWMVLVGVGLALICWRLLSGKTGSWLINANLWAAGLVLTGFCFVDTRAIAAHWNVTHAKEVGGRGVELDLCYMSTLGSGAILPLMSLEQRPLPIDFRMRVKFVREELEFYVADDTWSTRHNLDKARSMAPTLPALALGKAQRGCDGRIFQPASPSYSENTPVPTAPAN